MNYTKRLGDFKVTIEGASTKRAFLYFDKQGNRYILALNPLMFCHQSHQDAQMYLLLIRLVGYII